MGEFPVKVLRDSGCNGVVVRCSLVTESQLTGKTRVLMFMDQSLTEVPLYCPLYCENPHFFLGK